MRAKYNFGKSIILQHLLKLTPLSKVLYKHIRVDKSLAKLSVCPLLKARKLLMFAQKFEIKIMTKDVKDVLGHGNKTHIYSTLKLDFSVDFLIVDSVR